MRSLKSGRSSGVTLSLYIRKVDAAEENRIFHNATNKNRMNQASSNDMKASITAEANLQDVANLIASLNKNKEPLERSVLILGNSGEGKSYLLKLLLENCLEAGKTVIALDPEHELVDLSRNPNGCFIDLMSGQYIINPLEPKVWDVDGIRELTRPLFAIPTHQFIFHCGAVDKEFYMNNLQLEQSEYELIRYPQNGVCLYKCGIFLLSSRSSLGRLNRCIITKILSNRKAAQDVMTNTPKEPTQMENRMGTKLKGMITSWTTSA